MSEYQYYDFKAIDHALTKTEMATLRAISTRAVITTTSFTNHYEWGDLKADPIKLLEKYFDAFVYVANWGTREFHLRLPQELVDAKQIKAMLPGKLSPRATGMMALAGWDRWFLCAPICFGAIFAAFISDGCTAWSVTNSLKMRWSPWCQPAWGNCQRPLIR